MKLLIAGLFALFAGTDPETPILPSVTGPADSLYIQRSFPVQSLSWQYDELLAFHRDFPSENKVSLLVYARLDRQWFRLDYELIYHRPDKAINHLKDVRLNSRKVSSDSVFIQIQAFWNLEFFCFLQDSLTPADTLDSVPVHFAITGKDSLEIIELVRGEDIQTWIMPLSGPWKDKIPEPAHGAFSAVRSWFIRNDESQ